MNCAAARARLTAAPPGAPRREVREHLSRCSACRAFEARWLAATELLSAPRCEARPDPAFAARVVAALPAGPQTSPLGWAALRWMPAALALALVLLGWAWTTTPAPGDLIQDSAPDDLLVWVIEPAEGQ